MYSKQFKYDEIIYNLDFVMDRPWSGAGKEEEFNW